jgi:RNA polymerase primary sigma factor
MSDEMLAIVAKIAGIPFQTAKSAQLGYVMNQDLGSLDVPLDALDDKNFGSPFKRGSDTVLDTLDAHSTLDPELLATPTLEEELEKKDRTRIIHQFLKGLDAREEAVIRARFGFDDGEPKTLEAIGQMYHVTRERIRQIEAKALNKLKKRIEKSIYGDII